MEENHLPDSVEDAASTRVSDGGLLVGELVPSVNRSSPDLSEVRSIVFFRGCAFFASLIIWERVAPRGWGGELSEGSGAGPVLGCLVFGGCNKI